MKIALLGYGKMGKEVEQVALSRGHSIVEVEEAEVCIDFSHPDAVYENAQKAVNAGAHLVIGTTGWEKDYEAVKQLILSHNGGCVYSPNFSLGVQLFLQILSHAATLMREYDVAGTEMHHNQKVDSPSGTAKAIAAVLLQQMNQEVSFTSVRCGHLTGTHSVIFDSPADTITLTHEAKNRSGFALGAVMAAEHIKETKGWFTFAELLHSFV